jgi:molybdopterin molybdotransferase
MPLGSPHGYTIEEAQARFVAGIAPVGTEDLPLAASLGRILAFPLLAERLVPDSPRAAVDGWAVRSDDLAGASREVPVRLRVAGASLAGHPTAGVLERGETVRITTGGVVPEGADAAEYQEVCRTEGDYVLFARPVAPMANVRRAGEDMRPGQELLAAGERVRPEVIGLLATLAQERVQVRRRPRVRFVSTGDEIHRVGDHLPTGGTIDSNSLQIGGLLQALGADVELRGPVPDSAEAIAEACQGDSFDFLITSGGVSVGPADRIGEAGRMLGAKVMFHWARMRPGAPTMGLRLGDRPWLGLSGNPLSAQVGFDVFGRAAISRLIGAEAGLVRGQARIVAEFRGKAPDAPRLLRARVELVGAELHASIHPYQSSGGVRAMAQTNGYVIQPEGVAKLEAGSLVDALVLPV